MKKNPLTKLCFLQKSLVSVMYCDPTSLSLLILRMGIGEGGKSVVWASDSFTLNLDYLQTKELIYLIISENWYFRVSTKMQSLEYTLKPKGWTLEMPLMAISIESMLENYPPSPHELLWKKNVLIFGWVLFFLKSGVLSLLHKLRLNVVIMQKKNSMA